MKALNNFVIVRRIEEEVKKESGLIVTDLTDRAIRYKLGEVVSCGDFVLGLDAKDRIYFDSAASSEIRIEGEKLYVVPDRQVVIKL